MNRTPDLVEVGERVHPMVMSKAWTRSTSGEAGARDRSAALTEEVSAPTVVDMEGASGRTGLLYRPHKR